MIPFHHSKHNGIIRAASHLCLDVFPHKCINNGMVLTAPLSHTRRLHDLNPQLNISWDYPCGFYLIWVALHGKTTWLICIDGVDDMGVDSLQQTCDNVESLPLALAVCLFLQHACAQSCLVTLACLVCLVLAHSASDGPLKEFAESDQSGLGVVHGLKDGLTRLGSAVRWCFLENAENCCCPVTEVVKHAIADLITAAGIDEKFIKTDTLSEFLLVTAVSMALKTSASE